MRVSKLIRSVVPGAALLWALAGCGNDSPMSPSQPSETVAPSFDYSMTWGTYRLVRTSITTFEVSNTAVIGPMGGRLFLGLHELVVPRGAVSGPTRFTMTSKFGNNVLVDLNAVDLRTGAAVTEFPVAVQLKLSYLLLFIPRSQAHRVTIVWLKDDRIDGELVPIKTTVQPYQRYAVGWLTHFSKYAVGMN